jgi:hypothetical protein
MLAVLSVVDVDLPCCAYYAAGKDDKSPKEQTKRMVFRVKFHVVDSSCPKGIQRQIPVVLNKLLVVEIDATPLGPAGNDDGDASNSLEVADGAEELANSEYK